MDILTRGENQDVFDHYELVSVIKSGSMGTVSCVRKNPSQTSKSKTIRILPKLFQRDGCLKTNSTPSSQKEYALKTIQLGRIPDEKKITALWNEIDILRKCDHPNIVRVFEVYSQRRQLYLIMELCTGGELSARLPYAEHQANKITREILSAVFYLHERELIHRDRE